MREGLAARVAARIDLGRPLPVPHRALQIEAEACTYAGVLHDRPALLDRAEQCLSALRSQQGEDGLFEVGDNVCSPPDSSFTANGLARLVRVCRVLGAATAAIEGQASGILHATVPGLLRGGVHTPNHRWEMAVALAELADLYGVAEARSRAEEWLAEGIDIQADGLYSERSPHYAGRVSNPCLLRLATLLDRPDLTEIVHRNLHAHLLLIDGDEVESIQSRRQDQKLRVTVDELAWFFRAVALRTGCRVCGDAAHSAGEVPAWFAYAALGELLLHPDLADDLPTSERDAEPGAEPGMRPGAELSPGPTTEPGWTVLEPSGLTVWQGGRGRLVGRAARDVSLLRRAGSGIAANPTFARWRAGELRVTSLRLSRTFFGLGPFRATEMMVKDGALLLCERVSAAYYQPAAGADAYEFEGRFSAEMGFSGRATDEVVLTTQVRLMPDDGCLELVVTSEGPLVLMSLEIGFGDVEVSGGCTVALADGQLGLVGPGRVSVDGQPLDITVEGHEPEPRAAYDPGEAYTFLGGTDAVDGTRLYVSLAAPGRMRLVMTLAG